MKKIILLIFIAFSSLQFALAEEKDNQVVVAGAQISSTNNLDDNSDEPEPEENYVLFPKKHKSLYLSVENQIKLMTELLEKKGKREVIRYFLSLRNYNKQKAINLLSSKENPDLRLVILENLPISVFSEIISSFFSEHGGKAIAHWSYTKTENFLIGKREAKYDEDTFLTPPSRAQQYINFFMTHNALVLSNEARESSINPRSPRISKERGKKIAKVLNTFDEDTLIALLYGRPDTRIIDEKGEIVKGDPQGVYSGYKHQILKSDYFYLKHKPDYNGKDALTYVTPGDFDQTVPSSINQIDYILPYLSSNLIVAIFAEELKKDGNRLSALIKNIGCDMALNELFEYLEDSLKDSVFQACEGDKSILDILDLDKDSNNNPLQLGDGSKPKRDL